MIQVLAFIITHPGRRDEVLAAYRANIPFVLAEHGCQQYTAFTDPASTVAETPVPMGEDSFVIIEKWDDFSCLQAHRVTPHMKAYAAKTKDLIAKREVHVLTAVEEVQA